MLIKNDKFRESLDNRTLQQIEALLYQETELLDQGEYSVWLELFTQDCLYWVPATAGQIDAENQVSLFYEDRTLMQVRIAKLQHPQSHPMDYPLRTSHVISDRVLEDVDGDAQEVTVSARFLMTEYYRDEQRSFTGKYTYQLRREEEGYRIKLKRVDLINCDAILEPIQVFI